MGQMILSCSDMNECGLCSAGTGWGSAPFTIKSRNGEQGGAYRKRLLGPMSSAGSYRKVGSSRGLASYNSVAISVAS